MLEFKHELMKKVVLFAIAAGLVSVLSGCGRKGDLEAPGAYESQSTTGPAETKPKNDKPFFLDPLL